MEPRSAAAPVRRNQGMSLEQTTSAGSTGTGHPVHGLVLMGGGARTAYQVGVLRALAAILDLQTDGAHRFPFRILVGTSAGALNAVYLASVATSGLQAFELLAQFWQQLRSRQVYALALPAWLRVSRVAAALGLWRDAQRQGAILDTMPLVDTLHRSISLRGIDEGLASRAFDVVAATASSYTTGVHWTFCQARGDRSGDAWNRPGRRAEFQPLTIEHLMASSALPFLFPATPLWVDGRREYFGDGSMRQVSPLSSALHLGADRILVVGVGQPQRSGLGSDADMAGRQPTFGRIAGHALASVFHDTLQADVEQAQRITRTVRQLPPQLAHLLPYREVDVLAIQPSQSLDALAHEWVHELPASVRRALGALGALNGGGGMASYLLFEPGFVQALILLGAQDAYARKDELLAHFGIMTA